MKKLDSRLSCQVSDPSYLLSLSQWPVDNTRERKMFPQDRCTGERRRKRISGTATKRWRAPTPSRETAGRNRSCGKRIGGDRGTDRSWVENRIRRHLPRNTKNTKSPPFFVMSFCFSVLPQKKGKTHNCCCAGTARAASRLLQTQTRYS